MNPPPERDRLLDEVLSETTPAEFRGALLGETLRLARRRRGLRRARRATVALALLSLVGVWVWKSQRPHADGTAQPAPVASYELIRTQPFAAGAIVSTRAFGAERFVASVAGVGVIRTVSGAGSIHLIDDDELLALAAPRLAALVRVGPRSQELIFADPAEQSGAR